ncbi:MATE family efflux transporter [Phytomonospora endophytica]|uniref:O-antigen/teichoic acid export membrane protein n=1 Tax=Phytomonospora endophytica TaxID=714109 RepID=A0A841FD76_9ACTN|nr:oligosaccharide flippase family protein [Phytomonospora endophytica]MBB6033385.1 O-antigen/teichoic acid export membrane protein [Phytomonospora endophytica]
MARRRAVLAPVTTTEAGAGGASIAPARNAPAPDALAALDEVAAEAARVAGIEPGAASRPARPLTPPPGKVVAIPAQPTAPPASSELAPAPPPTAPPLRGVALGGIANLAGSAVSGGAGLVITWLVAAALGPDGAGLFFAATSAFLLATSLARLGTPTGLVYWIARLRATDHPAPARAPIRIGVTPVAALSVALGIAGYIAAPALAAAYSPDPAHVDDYARLLRLLAVFVPAGTVLDSLLAATRGLSTMKPTVYIERLGRTLAQLALLALAVSLSTADTAPAFVTVAWALPFIPATAVAAWWLRKRTTTAEGDPGLTPAAFWRYTAPRALASVAQLALQRLDILLVAGMLGFAEAALYTVATRFVIAGQLANLAVGSSLQPRIAAALSIKDTATARRLYRHTTTWIILLSWPMYLSAAVLAPEYLGLFGAEYRTGAAVGVVLTLAGAMLVASACGTVDTVLAMSGRTSWQLSNVITALVVNVAVNLWLIPRIGVLGAAVGWAAAVLANNLIPLAQLAFAERLHPFGRESGLAMAATAVCFGVLPTTAGLVLGGGARLPVAICGGVAYAVLLWRLRGPLLTRHLK